LRTPTTPFIFLRSKVKCQGHRLDMPKFFIGCPVLVVVVVVMDGGGNGDGSSSSSKSD